MPASDTKTAEFARLFDLFERLASRKSSTKLSTRLSTNDNTTIDDPPPPVPADLAHVVHSLAGLIRTRKPQNDARQKNKATGGRAHRNTLAASSTNNTDLDEDCDVSLAKFPLGRQYPFTFRMMLHKLYQLDDWAQKVKEVLERSQIEYKPLAEVEIEAEKQEEEGGVEASQEGRIHFKAGTVTGSRKLATRPRSHSIAVLGAKTRDGGPLSPSLKSPRYKGPVEEETRAVKKRCVGRRKSMSGPLTSEAGRIGGSWVYDATVSAAEYTGRGETSGFVSSTAISPSRQLKYGTLGEGAKNVKGARRISLGARNQLQRSSGGMIGRRRALSVMNNLTPI